MKAFGDQDGIIDIPQAVYDTPAKIALVKGLLQKYAAVSDPELRIEVVPWAMSHSIAGKGQAVKQLHGLPLLQQHAAPAARPEYVPAQGVPVIFGGRAVNVVNFGGKEPAFDNRPLLESFYIIGNSRAPWVEWAGWLSIVGAAAFSLVHGMLRFLRGRL